MKTEREYKAAIGKIETLLKQGFAALTQQQLTELEELSREVAAFEKTHYPVPAPQSLAEMIELRMYEMRLNQKQLAQLFGISPAKLSLILNGKQEPDLIFLKKCRHELNIPADFILDFA
jgi:HTH-type transcriptional regulator/antitoxin HigA